MVAPIVTYVSAAGAVGSASRAVRGGCRRVVVVIETKYRTARIRIQRRRDETASRFASRVVAAGRTAAMLGRCRR